MTGASSVVNATTASPAANAAAPQAAGAPGERSEFISFAIGDEQYGVNIMAVREIKGWSVVTHLPNQPGYVRGVLNLRGVMVPIVDLRCRFGQGNTETTPMHVVIIVQIGSRQVGLLADRVLDIVSFEPSQVQPVPRIDSSTTRVHFLSGLATSGETLLALVDLPNLVGTEMDADEIETAPDASEPASSQQAA
jgi:purine-binding chemotaxis protein CheW